MRALAVSGLIALPVSTAYCGGDSFTVATDGGVDGAPSPLDGAAQDTSVQDTSVQDASNDGAVADGAPPEDDAATTPDAIAIDAAPAPFSCAVPPAGTLFCADFDAVTNEKEGWDNEVTFGGGVVAFDTIDFQSAPHGLATAHGIASGAAGASLSRAFVGAATTIDFGFSMRVKTLDTTNDATMTVARLAVGDPLALYLDLLVDHTGVRFRQSVPQTDGGPADEVDPISPTVPLNEWVRVRIALDRGPTPAVRVYVKDVKVLDKPPITLAVKSPKLEVDVGIIFVQSPSTGNSISYDNVLVRGL